MKQGRIKIDENRCVGCGKCATACAAGVIKIINGKAKLIAPDHCDGLGVCIGHCPHDAITIMEPGAIIHHAAETLASSHCNCPSMQHHDLTEQNSTNTLQNWPIQLALVPATAAFLKNKELIIAADCTAFASAEIRAFLNPNSALLIACPKLDNRDYEEKLTQIIQNANPSKITVLRMEVPCCSALTSMVQTALCQAKQHVELVEQIILIK